MAKKIKKILSVVLAMTMIMGMSMTVMASNEISNIDISLNASLIPSFNVGDRIPDYASAPVSESPFILPNNVVYLIYKDNNGAAGFGFGYYYYDDDDGEYYPEACEDAIANAETRYAYFIELRPAEGYMFSSSLTVNGGTDNVLHIDIVEDDYCLLRYDIGTLSDIEALKGNSNTPCETPSTPSAPAAPIIPTDYVAERVAEEEAMAVSPVTIDTAQYGAGEAAVVPATSYNLSKFVTTKGIVKGIKTAVAAANNNKKDVAEIYTGKPFCFNKEIIKAIQEGNKTVVYYFAHEGHIYSVTVPATVDAAKVLEKAGFAGPLYVGQQLGTTRLVK